MKILPVVLALSSVLLPAFADEPRPVGALSVVETPGHTMVRVEPSERPAKGYIVEFHGAPLASRAMKMKDTDLSAYRETLARFRADVSGLGTSQIRSGSTPIRHEYFRTFHGVSAVLESDEVDAVRQLSYVKAVHEDSVVSAHATDTGRISRIGADRFWSERNSRGEGIVVAVIDSGVDYDHGAFGSGFGPGFKVIGGYDFVDMDDDPMDENGHGTHVAGIIAGDGAGVLGVAPAARLIAYRVLNASGEGMQSDTIAALERMIDPNQDGDLSDRVDVANLSLGGAGDADSPGSIAVDNAVAAGVVVALSAGNSGGGQSVGTPASSRLGITVGWSDQDDEVVQWSSRGPSFPDLGLKPEIVAPGEAIESARAGGGLVVMSGSSMSAPHVAGAAALLRSIYPEWTPAQVKAALIERADPVSAEVMAQGGGRLNVYEAGAATVLAEPAVVTFGNGPDRQWSASRAVTLSNPGSTSQTFSAGYVGDPGVTIIAEPALFTLAPGATQDVIVTAHVMSEAEGSAVTYAVGGHVSFSSDRELIRIPWVVVDANFAEVVYESSADFITAMWRCGSSHVTNSQSGGVWRALLPRRPCDLYLSAFEAGDVVLLIETHEIDEDVRFTRSVEDVPLELRLAGVDHTGALIAPEVNADEAYLVTYVFSPNHEDGDYTYSITSWLAGLLRTNKLPPGTLVNTSEMRFDFPNYRIVAVNHIPLNGRDSNLTMSTLPGDLVHAEVEVRPHRGDLDLLPLQVLFVDGIGMGYSPSSGPSLQDGWRGDLYVSRLAGEQQIFALPALMAGRNRLPDPTIAMRAPAFRVAGNRIVLSDDTEPSPAAYGVAAGELIVIGAGQLHARTWVNTNGTAFTVSPSYWGPAGEAVVVERDGHQYVIRDASGTILRSGSGSGAVTADFGARGAYSVEVRTESTDLQVSFDTSRTDSNPPSLTSLRIVDQNGLIRDRFPREATATLLFAVGDYVSSPEWWYPRYSREISSVRAGWRTDGGEWQELPIELVLEDVELSDMDPASGLIFRSDLSAVSASGASSVDLRIEMSDRSGNQSTMILNDAVTFTSRLRGVRR